MSSTWVCPYCNQIATIIEANVSSETHAFNNENKEKMQLWLKTFVVVCPNQECREFTITASLHKSVATGKYANGKDILGPANPAIFDWQLKPRSRAKPFPPFIPAAILEDYEEACLIVNDSPKASATLSRRCLQGIIRDYWGISRDKLFDEIKELSSKVDPSTWAAIDAVRSIGNIGAHMEKDINLIVDVDPGEAALLIRLLETLFKEWYVAREDRNKQMSEIVALAQTKAAERKPNTEP
jgi:hypothetical protein